MKKCGNCKEEKYLDAFSKNHTRKDGRQFWCKECSNKLLAPSMLVRQAKIRDFIYQFKNKPCTDCGVSYHPVVMDFDHREGEVKLFGLAQAPSRGKSEEDILAEISKCDLVCSNCHRMRTHRRKGLEPEYQLSFSI